MIHVPHVWYPFVFAFGVSTLMGWAMLRWVGPLGFMDLPEGRKWHECAIPRTGGLTFLITMLFGLVFSWYSLPLTPIQWACLTAMAAMGLADDRFGLRARYKAIVGLIVGVALAHEAAISMLAQHLNVHLVGGELPDSYGTYFTLLLLYFWCVPQSFNLVDGVNGLAIGYSAVVLGALSLGGHLYSFPLGAVAGLFVWNWPRARHFLGDCGSMSLGLLLALLVKKCFAHQDPNLILWIFAYPFVDTTMVVTVRILKGLHPAKADRSHLHHCWQDALQGKQMWVSPLLLIQAAACASAVVVRGWGWIIPCSGLAALVIQAIWFSIRRRTSPLEACSSSENRCS